MDANLNIAQCLREQTNFGETIVHNICNNTVASVPWGTADWALCLVLLGGALVFCLVFGSMGVSILRGY